MTNEKRLIDAKKFGMYLADIQLANRGWKDDICEFLDDMMDALDEAPTVDAVEVVHGYWIDSYSADHMGRIIEHSIDCSVCDSVFKDDSREVVKRWKERFKVCPFCGAVMDGGNEDG